MKGHGMFRLAVCALLIGVTGPVHAQDRGRSEKSPLVIAKFGNFFVGGSHNANDQMVGAMYVEYVIPHNQTQRYPIILVHGGGQIGAGWSQTLDGSCSSRRTATRLPGSFSTGFRST